jgi:type IV pilus assembly protein PilN
MAIQVPINLATEPFRRDRPALVAFSAVAVLLAVLLGVQGATILSERSDAADTRVTIDRLSAQLRRIQAEQSQLNARLGRPENALVLERSLFLNTLIDRKAISWTKIFADLEKVMPYNVRLVSVRLPEVDSENQVLLDMVVGSKEVAPVLELLKRLEASPQFGPASVLNSIPPSQTDPYFRYHVSVSYAQKL